jgi:hypothetical protein
MIDVEELIKAFKDLGVEVDRTEAMKLLQRYFHMFRYISFSVTHVCSCYGLKGYVSCNFCYACLLVFSFFTCIMLVFLFMPSICSLFYFNH